MSRCLIGLLGTCEVLACQPLTTYLLKECANVFEVVAPLAKSSNARVYGRNRDTGSVPESTTDREYFVHNSRRLSLFSATSLVSAFQIQDLDLCHLHV